jgi:tRNA-2-methylthio-N6-dimethylallyladenosine synthase
MNEYDSNRIYDLTSVIGFKKTIIKKEADCFVLNTCHIREKATEKVYDEIGRVRKDFRNLKKPLVIVSGCVAQAESEEMIKREPYIDMVIGPQSYHKIGDLILDYERKKTKINETEFDVVGKFDELQKISNSQNKISSYITIQEGCDKFCPFCVVPYTRGAEYSRPVSEIIFEAQSLVQCGVQEITLLGQNVNAYHGLKPDQTVASLSVLIEELGTIDGLSRIRYTTSHPKDMDDGLISAHKRLPFLMPYLHLPVQSGSNRILRAMNRGYSAEDYLVIADQLRNARPDIALSSDFIVGFPGETEADFEATLRLVEKVKFSQAYSFKYSPRPGTPASEMTNQIDNDVSAERLGVLQQLLDDQQRTFNRSKVGTKLEVLLEKPGRKQGQLVGRSLYMQAVHVESMDRSIPLTIGHLIEVDVVASNKNSLAAIKTDQPICKVDI